MFRSDARPPLTTAHSQHHCRGLLPSQRRRARLPLRGRVAVQRHVPRCAFPRAAWPSRGAGAVNVFEPEVLTIGTMKFLDPEHDCVKFGYCSAEDAPALGDAHRAPGRFSRPAARRNAKLNYNLPSKASAATKKNSGILRILQVTDIHHDPNYMPGTWTNCGQPLCCRDVPYSNNDMNASSTAGYYGDLNCDPPASLLTSMFDAMANVYPPPDLGFLTGDDPPHNIWNQTREYNINCSNIIVSMVRKAMPNLTFFPALGNHNGARAGWMRACSPRQASL